MRPVFFSEVEHNEPAGPYAQPINELRAAGRVRPHATRDADRLTREDLETTPHEGEHGQ
jgi:hypothetical protein